MDHFVVPAAILMTLVILVHKTRVLMGPYVLPISLLYIFAILAQRTKAQESPSVIINRTPNIPVIVSRNVAFRKVGDIQITRSRWIYSLVIDLQPYAEYLGKVEHDTKRMIFMSKALDDLPGHIRNKKEYSNHIASLRVRMDQAQENLKEHVGNYNEIEEIIKSPGKHGLPKSEGKTRERRQVNSRVKSGYGYDYDELKLKTDRSAQAERPTFYQPQMITPMHPGDRDNIFGGSRINPGENMESKTKRIRKKRALFPFLGKLHAFLYGTLTQADLDAVTDNIHTLEENQKELFSIAKTQVTIANLSRQDISLNRGAINNLTDTVRDMYRVFWNLTDDLSVQLEDRDYFMSVYMQFDALLTQLEDALLSIEIYVEHLTRQLDMLSMNHLSPSVVYPELMSDMLTEVESHLPSHLKLPYPTENLYSYYSSLPATAVMHDSKIIVLVEIPLVDAHEYYSLFRVFTAPVPLPTWGVDDPPEIAAQYRLDTHYFAVDPNNEKFMNLNQEEGEQCSHALANYCHITSPVYHRGQVKSCVLALYLGIKGDTPSNPFGGDVTEHCTAISHEGTTYPKAISLGGDGHYLIITRSEFQLSVTCSNATYHEFTQININETITHIRLKMGCSATSKYLDLPPYYYYNSNYGGNYDVMRGIQRLSDETSFDIWKPLTDKYPKLSKVDIPAHLKAIQQVPLQSMLDAIGRYKALNVWHRRVPTWVYIVVCMLGTLIILACIVCVWKKCKSYKMEKKSKEINRNRRTAKMVQNIVKSLWSASKSNNIDLADIDLEKGPKDSLDELVAPSGRTITELKEGSTNNIPPEISRQLVQNNRSRFHQPGNIQLYPALPAPTESTPLTYNYPMTVPGGMALATRFYPD